jgi:hypothetical protein
MAPAGQQAKASLNRCVSFGLGQDAAPAGDDGVGREDAAVAAAADAVLDCERLGRGDALCVRAREFTGQRAFIDVCGLDAVRPDADLLEERQPPRASTREDERGTRHYLLR